MTKPDPILTRGSEKNLLGRFSLLYHGEDVLVIVADNVEEKRPFAFQHFPDTASQILLQYHLPGPTSKALRHLDKVGIQSSRIVWGTDVFRVA